MAIAYFSTWTTYGTWLPGDERGWYDRGVRAPDRWRKMIAGLLQKEHAIVLDSKQRGLVESVIREHCAIRKWELHAVNCRSNHIHVVVTAANRSIEAPREQFKSWTTRRLKEFSKLQNPKDELRLNWWSERGWDEYIDDDRSLAEIIRYVLEGQ